MSICRLTVQAQRGSDSCTIDVALPAGTPVCALLPTIVSWAGVSQGPGLAADDWRLDRLSGATIDDSMTLTENGIHDGELLILACRHVPPPALTQWDPSRTVATTDPPTKIGDEVRSVGACAWSAAVGSIGLVSAKFGTHDMASLIVAAAGSCAAAFASLTTRSGGATIAAVCLAAAAGFLAVPAPPCAASIFLAAAAGGSMSLLMQRSAARPTSAMTTSTLVATASLCALTAVATVAPVICTLSMSGIGATLATVSIALLCVAPRVAVVVSGLRPYEHPDDCEERSQIAHATLTGLVVGCSGGVAVGALVVAVDCRRHDPPTLASVLFTVTVGLVVALRARTYVDEPRRIAVQVGGLLSLTAAFAIIACAIPAHAAWASTLVIAIGLLGLRHRSVGPRVMRAVELAEYATLAAVLPMACWVGGLYSVIREAQLP